MAKKTVEYLKSGKVSDDWFVCEECSDASEATAIARRFAKIVSQIEQQVEQQGGWE